MATYATAIAVILESRRPDSGLTTKQLCALLEQHSDEIPIMKRSGNWRNGIRHTLSGNDGFWHVRNQSCLMPWRYNFDKLPKNTQSALRQFRAMQAAEPNEDPDKLVTRLFLQLLRSNPTTMNHLPLSSTSHSNASSMQNLGHVQMPMAINGAANGAALPNLMPNGGLAMPNGNPMAMFPGVGQPGSMQLQQAMASYMFYQQQAAAATTATTFPQAQQLYQAQQRTLNSVASTVTPQAAAALPMANVAPWQQLLQASAPHVSNTQAALGVTGTTAVAMPNMPLTMANLYPHMQQQPQTAALAPTATYGISQASMPSLQGLPKAASQISNSHMASQDPSQSINTPRVSPGSMSNANSEAASQAILETNDTPQSSSLPTPVPPPSSTMPQGLSSSAPMTMSNGTLTTRTSSMPLPAKPMADNSEVTPEILQLARVIVQQQRLQQQQQQQQSVMALKSQAQPASSVNKYTGNMDAALTQPAK
eukprot:TRINITY_DN11830_c4_g1_i1.p1 TRINITY_DN11830_c4_g1~~TRINITY_DN11830_c4_g1_i1.p1  ORF type:complete len:479 (+),score=105.63 TRINITY_DN11830_c4_g1_i1:476-1912(+)